MDSPYHILEPIENCWSSFTGFRLLGKIHNANAKSDATTNLESSSERKNTATLNIKIDGSFEKKKKKRCNPTF